MIQFIQGNALNIPMKNESVQCVVTSPPYYGLRDYGTAKWEGGDADCDHITGMARNDTNRETPGGRGGSFRGGTVQYSDICGKCGAHRIDSQIGLEQSPEEYVATMVAVFRELWRVLRPDGTVWLVLGDSYFGDSPVRNSSMEQFDPNYQTVLKRSAGGKRRSAKSMNGLKPKDLIGIPWRVAFALQIDGWWLRSEIIWHKPNPMPESVIDRPTKCHEYIFLLTKKNKYYYDAQAILEPAAYDGRLDTKYKGGAKDVSIFEHERWSKRLYPNGNNQSLHDYKHSGYWKENGDPLFRLDIDGQPARNKRSVWVITTNPYKGAHFATFPPDLIEPCILAGTSAKGACEKCGTPWKRIIKKTRDFVSGSGKSGNIPIGKNGINLQGGGETIDVRRGPIVNSLTVGWKPNCRCDAGDPIPCIVLDPFNGSGTTGEVCLKHGRDYVGIELSHQYIHLSKKRIHGVQISMISGFTT